MNEAVIVALIGLAGLATDSIVGVLTKYRVQCCRFGKRKKDEVGAPEAPRLFLCARKEVRP